MCHTISVVVPTHNGSTFLAEALDSVFNQSLAATEIIVVDDASTDGTGDVVTAIARHASIPVRLIRLPKNSGGPARPINIGIQLASGEFIAVLDQDDLWMPSKLEEQLAVLSCNKGITYVFGLAAYYHKPTVEIQGAEVLKELQENGRLNGMTYVVQGMEALRLLLDHGCFVWGYPGFLFRRRDWERRGGVNESLRIGSDYDLICWLSTQGSVGFLPKIHYLRRAHATNMCHDRAQMHLDGMRVQAGYIAHWNKFGLDQSHCERFRDQAYRLGYFLREAGLYRQALRCHVISYSALGLDRRTAVALAKLLPHWVYARITLRPPIYSRWTRQDVGIDFEVQSSVEINQCFSSANSGVD